MARLSFILLSFMLFSSCGQDFSSEIAQVEVLQDSVKQSEEKFQGWDLNTLLAEGERIGGIVDEVVRIAKEKEVTLSIEDANMVADYKAATKAYRNLKESFPMVKSEIDYSKTQLEILLGDLTHKRLNKTEANTHINSEKKAVENLTLEITKLEDNFTRADQRVERMESKVKALISRLSS